MSVTRTVGPAASGSALPPSGGTRVPRAPFRRGPPRVRPGRLRVRPGPLRVRRGPPRVARARLPRVSRTARRTGPTCSRAPCGSRALGPSGWGQPGRPVPPSHTSRFVFKSPGSARVRTSFDGRASPRPVVSRLFSHLPAGLPSPLSPSQRCRRRLARQGEKQACPRPGSPRPGAFEPQAPGLTVLRLCARSRVAPQAARLDGLCPLARLAAAAGSRRPGPGLRSVGPRGRQRAPSDPGDCDRLSGPAAPTGSELTPGSAASWSASPAGLKSPLARGRSSAVLRCASVWPLAARCRPGRPRARGVAGLEGRDLVLFRREKP